MSELSDDGDYLLVRSVSRAEIKTKWGPPRQNTDTLDRFLGPCTAPDNDVDASPFDENGEPLDKRPDIKNGLLLRRISREWGGDVLDEEGNVIILAPIGIGK